MSNNATSTRLKQWMRRLILAAIAVFLLLALTLYILLGTLTGNRWLMAVATQAEPRLAATLETGTLLDQATLSNVSWTSPGIDITIPLLEWRWDWSCLKDDTLCLDLLRTQGGSVTLTANPVNDELNDQVEGGDFQLPFVIELRNAQLQQTRIDIYGHIIELDDLQGAARFNSDGLQISSPKLRALNVTIPAAAEKVARTAALVLPEISLPFPIQIDDFDLETTRLSLANSNYLLDHLQLTAEAKGSKIELKHLTATNPEVTLHAEGRIDLINKYPLELNAEIELLDMPPLSGVKAQLNANGSIAALAVEIAAQGPVTGTLSAQAALLKPTLPFSAELSWQNFNWPTKQPTLHSRQGIAKIDGSLEGYNFELAGDADGEHFPYLVLNAEGHGDALQMQLVALTLKTLDGEAALSGNLRWDEELTWQGTLQLQQINPAELVIGLPGRLNGQLESAFRLRDGVWDLRLPKIAIEGELSGQPLQLHGSVQGNQAGDWQFTRLQLQSGHNSLQIDGQIGKESDLSGKIELADLQTSFTQATGSASGIFTILGQHDALQLDFSLNAQGLAHAGKMLGALDAGGQLTIDIQNLLAIPIGSVQIEAKDITSQGFSFARLDADYHSDHNGQDLTLDLEGESISLQSRLKGQLSENIWSGQLQKSRLNSPLGDWRLDQPLNLSYDFERHFATIDKHCWNADVATLCLNETSQIGSVGQLNISLTDYSSTQLTDLFPDQFSWQGSLSGNAEAEWTPKQKPWIKLNLSAGSGRIGIMQGGQTVQGDYQQLKINALVDEMQAHASLLLRSDSFGQVDINLQLPHDREERTIEGEFHLSDFQLSILQPLFEPLDEVAGTVDADGKFFGNLKRPQINGKVVMQNGRLMNASLPTEIDQVNLELKLEGFRSQLSGDLLLGSGRADLAGAFSWEQQPITGWMSLKGERHKISFEPELDLLVSPDLRLELQEEQLALSGKINVPYARAKIRTLPQEAVRLSDDVVVLDKPKPKRTQKALPLSLDIEVTLQDNVEIDAFGLKSRLDGRLTLKQAAEQPLSGNGSIDLRDGTYRAFGQNLVIKKGLLIFSGPLSKPFLDVDAIRNPEATSDNVIAGIQLRGKAQNPKVTIYSEPAMSQQEAISYLLRGRSLGASSGSSQDTMVASMLLGAGIGKTEGVIGGLGETFGVKDMAVDTSGEGSDTQVKVSGYVLPGVQVGYGVGIFSPISVISVRYEILPKLILEAVSGFRSAADLLYEFEF